MIVTTTPTIEGKKIVRYLGIVTGEVIEGANFLRDLGAALSDFFWWKSFRLRRGFHKGKR